MFECVSGLHRFSAFRAELGLSTSVTSAQRTRQDTSCDPRHVGDGRSASYVSAAVRTVFTSPSLDGITSKQVLAGIAVRKSARLLTVDGIHDGKEDVEPVVLLCVLRCRVSPLCLPFACTRRCHRHIQGATRMITSEGGTCFRGRQHSF